MTAFRAVHSTQADTNIPDSTVMKGKGVAILNIGNGAAVHLGLNKLRGCNEAKNCGQSNHVVRSTHGQILTGSFASH